MNKSKFTEELQNELIDNYEAGLPLTWASTKAGVTRKTVYEWLNKGKEEQEGEYYDFYINMLRARARFVAVHLAALNESTSDKTHRYLLEVTDPENFVVSNKLEHSGGVSNTNIEIDPELLDEIIAEKKKKYSKE